MSSLGSENGFKIRKDCSWMVNRGVAVEYDELPLDSDIPVCQDGANLPLKKGGLYRVEYYPRAEVMRVSLLEESKDEDPAPDPEESVIEVYVDVTATGWSNVGVWAWSLADSSINYTGGSWPGAEIATTTDVDGRRYYVWGAPKDLDGQTIGFIANNLSGGEQTVDLSVAINAENNAYVTLTQTGNDGKWMASIEYR